MAGPLEVSDDARAVAETELSGQLTVAASLFFRAGEERCGKHLSSLSVLQFHLIAGAGGVATSRQLLDAAIEFEAAQDFSKARTAQENDRGWVCLVLSSFPHWV